MKLSILLRYFNGGRKLAIHMKGPLWIIAEYNRLFIGNHHDVFAAKITKKNARKYGMLTHHIGFALHTSCLCDFTN